MKKKRLTIALALLATTISMQAQKKYQMEISLHNGKSYYVPTDSVANVSFLESIDQIADGSTLLDSKKSRLQGKTFATIWDSLGGGWTAKLSDLTGMSCLSFSADGTNSAPNAIQGTLGRVKKLVDQKDKNNIDLVLLENVNDISLVATGKGGDINDPAWMQGEKVTAHQGVFSSYEEAVNYRKTKLSTILDSIPETERKAGCMLIFPYQNSSRNGTCVKVTSVAKKKGSILLTRKGTKFGIEVDPSMTIYDIAAKIAEYNYGAGWSAVNNGDGSVTISYCYKTDDTFEYTGNDTGVGVELELTSCAEEYTYYYLGKSASSWKDESQWSENVSLTSCYKGALEYLATNLPEAKLYFVLPTNYLVDFSDQSYKNEDGTYNLEKFQTSWRYVQWQKLRKIVQDVCELYSVPVLDVDKKCGISIFNIENYYYTNNVHPQQKGYDRWAETLYDMLK